MFKLIVALGVAVMLLPEGIAANDEVQTTTGTEAEVVSTYDTLSAANSLYQDLVSFCDRNEEACLTGKALASNAVIYAQNALAALGEKQQLNSTPKTIDQVLTGSIQTSSQR